MSELAKIDFKFVEKNRSRHGQMRYYFRYEGKRLGRLPDDPESEEFFKLYRKHRRAVEQAEAQPAAADAPATLPKVAQPGTFHFMCTAYLSSDAYTRLDKTTQAKRRQIIDSMLLEPLSPEDPRLFAYMPIAALDVANLEVLRDRKRDTPFAADERVKVLGQVFENALAHKPKPLVKANLALLVKRYRKKTEGHATIRPDEIASYIEKHGANSKAVLALTILMFTGIRVSDLALLGPQHRRGNTFLFRVFKNRNRRPTTLEIPVHPILDAVLKMHRPKGMNYMITEYGHAFSIKGLSQRVSAWFDQAGLKHLTAHSVRKGLATNIAENEATDLMLEGMFGWTDGKTSKIYTRNAQRARLARQAVSKIDWGEIGNLLPHPESDTGKTARDAG